MSKPMRWQDCLAHALAEVLRQSLRTSFGLFKVAVPITLLIRLPDQLGVIK
jgi:hypothetical protein